MDSPSVHRLVDIAGGTTPPRVAMIRRAARSNGKKLEVKGAAINRSPLGGLFGRC